MNLAQADVDVRLAWTEFEDALSEHSPDASEKAWAWWEARETYRAVLLETVAA